MSVYQTLLEHCEADVRNGQAHLAAKRLREVSLARLPRELRLPLANVCRRAQLISTGLKILSPVIHPKSRLSASATSGEYAEYSVLLTRLGAINEALGYLDRVNASEVPEGHLYKAFCRFNQWEYGKALPDLQSYLRADLKPYPLLIGRVNLAACQVAVRMFDEAHELLTENIALARKGNYARLQGNCHELRAQVHLLRGDAARASHDLDKAAKLLGDEKTFDELFVRKWRAVLKSQESGSVEPLLDFRAEALARNDSESLREADFYRLRLAFDEKLFAHVLFGTPFAGYRSRICEDLGRTPTASYHVHGEMGPLLDLESGLGRFCPSLEAGTKIHQLFGALLRDFYRPVRLGGLFAELFPGEAFDAFSSPDRVYQLLYRARLWLREARLPVEITADSGLFKLEIRGAFAFRVPLERKPLDESHLRIEALRKRFATDSWGFTPEDARTSLGLSASAFKRFAAWATESGQLKREGAGRATKYRFG